MTSTTSSAEQIQQEMRQVRTDLGDDVSELVDNAREMTTWQRYVQAYPWACLGTAAVAGYLVVPSRHRGAQAATAPISKLIEDQFAKHAGQKSTSRSGMVTSALSGISSVATKGLIQLGMTMLGQYVDDYLAKASMAKARTPLPDEETSENAQPT